MKKKSRQKIYVSIKWSPSLIMEWLIILERWS